MAIDCIPDLTFQLVKAAGKSGIPQEALDPLLRLLNPTTPEDQQVGWALKLLVVSKGFPRNSNKLLNALRAAVKSRL